MVFPEIMKILALPIVIILLLGGISSAFYLHHSEADKLPLTREELTEKWKKASPAVEILHTGDLILRHGRGFISNAFMSMSLQDQKYSHSGLIHIEDGKTYVYHAIGGEENVTNDMKKDRIEDFCDPASVHSFGIYRYDLNEEELERLDSLAGDFYRKKLQFDTHLDLSTDSLMYCSEFIYKVLGNVSHDKNYIPLSEITGKKYIAIDNLYLNKHCTFIYDYNY